MDKETEILTFFSKLIFLFTSSLYPKTLIGFDLVGQEDTGRPLIEFVSILNQQPETAKFFFHAGETSEILEI